MQIHLPIDKQIDNNTNKLYLKVAVIFICVFLNKLDNGKKNILLS